MHYTTEVIKDDNGNILHMAISDIDTCSYNKFNKKVSIIQNHNNALKAFLIEQNLYGKFVCITELVSYPTDIEKITWKHITESEYLYISKKELKAKTQSNSPYKRLGTYLIEEVLDFIPYDNNGNFIETVPKDKLYGNYSVHMNSLRYANFKAHGITCVKCGLVGKYFSLDLPKTQNRPHFNLYAVSKNGKEIMLTKDHIIPASLGGKNNIDNFQVLCSKCNEEKSNNFEINIE